MLNGGGGGSLETITPGYIITNRNWRSYSRVISSPIGIGELVQKRA